MTRYHVLNGDCLADQLKQTKINQDFIVCRECLIDGKLSTDTIADFWNVRADFIAEAYNVRKEHYFHKTVREFEKLINLPDHSEVCLWFENDLFCQTNMWFVISILAHNPTYKIFRIFPFIVHSADTWKGFGIATTEQLEQAYYSKIQLSSQDIELGKNAWSAYQNNDFDTLKDISKIPSSCFEYLPEICQAHIERFPKDKTLGRPDQVVKEIIETISTDFGIVFSTFSEREGIYGFGDLQIRKIYDRLMRTR